MTAILASIDQWLVEQWFYAAEIDTPDIWDGLLQRLAGARDLAHMLGMTGIAQDLITLYQVARCRALQAAPEDCETQLAALREQLVELRTVQGVEMVDFPALFARFGD